MSEPAAEAAPEAPQAPETPEPTTPPAEAEKPSELEPVSTDEAWDPTRAKEKIRKLNAEIKATKDRLEKAPKADDVAALTKRTGDLEAAVMRYEVAFDLGLPKEIATRLQGATREEMVADAEKLVELIAPAKRPTQKPTEVLRGGLTPDTEPEETDVRKLGDRMFNR